MLLSGDLAVTKMENLVLEVKKMESFLALLLQLYVMVSQHEALVVEITILRLFPKQARFMFAVRTYMENSESQIKELFI